MLSVKSAGFMVSGNNITLLCRRNLFIRFVQGLPEYNDDLGDIDIGFNHILVFDDLILQAKDSVIVSKLFTQIRHRDASVILML